MLTINCQAGTPVTPSLIITHTGDVRGKMVRAIQMGLSGNNIIVEMNQSGATAGRVKIVISCCPSRELELMAPMLAEITANNRYPRIKYTIPIMRS